MVFLSGNLVFVFIYFSTFGFLLRPALRDVRSLPEPRLRGGRDVRGSRLSAEDSVLDRQHGKWSVMLGREKVKS